MSTSHFNGNRWSTAHPGHGWRERLFALDHEYLGETLPCGAACAYAPWESHVRA